jgi:hypothetical protein
MAAAGLSTLGITFGYGTEATAGTKPTSFKQLTRINSIGGINIEPEQIDASALEDAITRYVKGRFVRRDKCFPLFFCGVCKVYRDRE